MKKLMIFLLFSCLSIAATAQWQFGLGYNYMFASGWDRAIQTYNFARPDLINKQPLLIHGTDLSGTYLWKSEKPMKHGFTSAYRYFRSSVENENFNVALNAHLVNLGYMIHNSAAAKNGRFSFDVSISLILGGIYRNVNGEPLRDDERRIWAPGIGGELHPRFLCDIVRTESVTFSVYGSAHYCPFYYSPIAEALLNQTMTLTGQKYTSLTGFEAGIVMKLPD